MSELFKDLSLSFIQGGFQGIANTAAQSAQLEKKANMIAAQKIAASNSQPQVPGNDRSTSPRINRQGTARQIGSDSSRHRKVNMRAVVKRYLSCLSKELHGKPNASATDAFATNGENFGTKQRGVLSANAQHKNEEISVRKQFHEKITKVSEDKSFGSEECVRESEMNQYPESSGEQLPVATQSKKYQELSSETLVNTKRKITAKPTFSKSRNIIFGAWCDARGEAGLDSSHSMYKVTKEVKRVIAYAKGRITKEECVVSDKHNVVVHLFRKNLASKLKILEPALDDPQSFADAIFIHATKGSHKEKTTAYLDDMSETMVRLFKDGEHDLEYQLTKRYRRNTLLSNNSYGNSHSYPIEGSDQDFWKDESDYPGSQHRKGSFGEESNAFNERIASDSSVSESYGGQIAISERFEHLCGTMHHGYEAVKAGFESVAAYRTCDREGFSEAFDSCLDHSLDAISDFVEMLRCESKPEIKDQCLDNP